MGVKVCILTAMTLSVIFIDSLCAQLHIFRQTTHQTLMSPKNKDYEYAEIPYFLGIGSL